MRSATMHSSLRSHIVAASEAAKICIFIDGKDQWKEEVPGEAAAGAADSEDEEDDFDYGIEVEEEE